LFALTHRGQPAKLVVADVLPADVGILPAPERRGDSTMAADPGGMETQTAVDAFDVDEAFAVDDPPARAEEL